MRYWKVILLILLVAGTASAVRLKKGPGDQHAFGTNAAQPATCSPGNTFAETDTLNLCVCYSADTWTCSPSLAEDHLDARTGGNAAETTLSLNNYDVMNMSLEEEVDENGCFTTTANQTCYVCARTIEVHMIAAVSYSRTTGAGTDVVTMAFGQDTTGAIDDGDEFGDEYQRTLSVNAIIGMGAIAASTTLVTDQCISLMAKTNDTAGGSGFTMIAASLRIEGE